VRVHQTAAMWTGNCPWLPRTLTGCHDALDRSDPERGQQRLVLQERIRGVLLEMTAPLKEVHDAVVSAMVRTSSSVTAGAGTKMGLPTFQESTIRNAKCSLFVSVKNMYVRRTVPSDVWIIHVRGNAEPTQQGLR
jgi:hypothetical protein